MDTLLHIASQGVTILLWIVALLLYMLMLFGTALSCLECLADGNTKHSLNWFLLTSFLLLIAIAFIGANTTAFS